MKKTRIPIFPMSERAEKIALQAKIEYLVGSVKTPARFKALSLEEIISKAKKEHFKHADC